MTSQLRTGVVEKKPVGLEGEIECDELYLSLVIKAILKPWPSKAERVAVAGSKASGDEVLWPLKNHPSLAGYSAAAKSSSKCLTRSVSNRSRSSLCLSRPSSLVASFAPMSTPSTPAYQRGAMTPKPSTTLKASMRGMKMAMAFMKFISTPSKAFGLCYVAGYGLIVASLRKSCLCI
jgi:hypothetical protein